MGKAPIDRLMGAPIFEKLIQKISEMFLQRLGCLDFCCVDCVCPMQRHKERKDVVVCPGCNKMVLVRWSEE